jgi:hypothetical protein
VDILTPYDPEFNVTGGYEGPVDFQINMEKDQELDR